MELGGRKLVDLVVAAVGEDEGGPGRELRRAREWVGLEREEWWEGVVGREGEGGGSGGGGEGGAGENGGGGRHSLKECCMSQLLYRKSIHCCCVVNFYNGGSVQEGTRTDLERVSWRVTSTDQRNYSLLHTQQFIKCDRMADST